MKVLGIDPGLRLTGFGCVATPGPGGARAGLGQTRARDAELIDAGVIRLDVKTSVSDRLLELEVELVKLIDDLRPDLAVVETLYAHYKHPATAIVMGHARGVILLAIRRAGVPLVELRPNEIKKSLTGFGHAKKGQMQKSIAQEFGMAQEPKPADVADAIAIALAGLRRARIPGA